MINRVVLTGRITKDVELKYTSKNIPIALFTLAVNRMYKDKDGNRDADFIRCVIWRKGAENLNTYAKKGSLIGVDGRIQTSTYTNADGNQVYVTEVVVETFTLLETKNSQSQTSSKYNNKNQSYSNNYQTYDNNSSAGDTIDITDDDLPF